MNTNKKSLAVSTLMLLLVAMALAALVILLVVNFPALATIPIIFGTVGTRTGSYSIEDLRKNRFQSIVQYGVDTINQVLQRDLEYANSLLTERLADLAETSSDLQRIYGVSGKIRPVKVDEFGRAPTRKDQGGVTVAFPMWLYKQALGWTSKFLELASPAEIAEQYLKIRQGHIAQVNNEIALAIFNDTNYDFVDQLDTQTTLAVKRLINADSSVIPDSPGGQTFNGASHTHYLARASTLANSDIDGLISTITEHGLTRGLKIILNKADVAGVTALSKFIPMGDPGLIYTASNVTQRKLDFSDLENQLIGFWGNTSVEVWVKPWGVDDYIFAYASGESEKVLVRRQRPVASLTGLRIIERVPGYPLVTENTEAEYGFGVWNRLAGAVLYIGGTSWTNPDLSALQAS